MLGRKIKIFFFFQICQAVLATSYKQFIVVSKINQGSCLGCLGGDDAPAVKFWMCINGLRSEARRYSYNISYKEFISIDYQVYTLEENPLDIITNKPIFTVRLDVLKRNQWKEKVGFVFTIFDLEKPKKTRWQKLKKILTDQKM